MVSGMGYIREGEIVLKKTDITNRVQELIDASDAYYNSDKPFMSDAEFDSKLEELRQWENETGIVLSNSPTHSVGAVVLNNIPKIIHKTPMLSLDKCHSIKEIIEFSNDHNLVGSIKLDGLTVRLTYKDGELIQAESRGNGTEGSLVTEHVKNFLNVPLHINKEGIYIIDGEALIKLDDFAEINKNGEYKNSRNLASGTLANLDTSVVRDRRMRWYAWEVVEGSKESDSFTYSLMEAEELGFEVVPFGNITWMELPYDEVVEYFLDVATKMNLPQDGVVFKFEEVEYGKSLGNTSHHFNNGIAYKIANDAYETELLNIEYTMGKTGVLTPVAVFKPVEIEGSIVEKASLHNISVMNEIMGDNPWIGQHIGVYKANLIIPQVRWAEEDDDRTKNYVSIPSICPICGQSTKIVKENDSEVLMCTNDDCKGRLLGKLTHFCSKNAINIDGMSEATLEFLINKGWISSFSDIYMLDWHGNEWIVSDGFGQKSVLKLLNSIKKSKNTALDRFLYALSIPLLGQTASKDISNLCNGNFEEFVKIMKDSPEKLLTIDGFGTTMLNSVTKWWYENSLWVYDLSKEFTFKTPQNQSTNNSLNGKVFVITGSVNHYDNRDALKADIEAHGGKVSSSISVKTSFLINNDINSTSGKNKKAKELNIPIISEEQFLAMI